MISLEKERVARGAILSAPAFALDKALLYAICCNRGSGPSDAVTQTKDAAAMADAVGALCVGQLCERALVEARVPGTECLTHKGRLALLTAMPGEEIAPPTTLVRSTADLTAVMGAAEHGQLWYLKHPLLQRGQGISIISSATEGAKLIAAEHSGEGARGDAPAALVLQRAVDPPALIDGCKFGLRVHLLIVCPPSAAEVSATSDAAAAAGVPIVAWVHDDAVLTICGAPYDTTRTDSLTHITCTSVQRHLPGFKRERVKGAATLLWPAGWARVLPLIRRALGRLLAHAHPELSVAALGWPPGHTAFQVLGCDFIVGADGTPWLLELNEVRVLFLLYAPFPR